METQEKTVIRIETTVNAPVQKVWEYWTKPEHITKWNQASDDWHTPWAKSDFREGGSFTSRMEAKDGSFGFEFGGVFDVIRNHEYIEYTIGDGRKVKNNFIAEDGKTKVVTNFEAESENPVEMQRGGWLAILESFKRYVESN